MASILDEVYDTQEASSTDNILDEVYGETPQLQSPQPVPTMEPGPSFAVGLEQPDIIVDRNKAINQFADQIGIKVDVSEPGASMWDRIGFAAAPKHDDVVKRWRKDHPEGQIAKMDVPGLGPMLFSKKDLLNEEEPWRPVNKTGLEAGDFANLIEDAPAIGAQVALALSPQLRGAGLLKNVGAEIIAGMGIRIGQDMVQQAQGYDPFVSDSVLESIVDGALIAPFAKAEKGLLPEGGQAAKKFQEMARASDEEGVKLPPTAYIDNKITERLQQQVRMTWSGIDAAEEKAKEQMGDIVNRMISGQGVAQQSAGKKIKQSAAKNIDKRLAEERAKVKSTGIKGQDVEFTAAGKDMQSALERWQSNTRKTLQKKYNSAFEELGKLDVPLSVGGEGQPGTIGIAKGIVEGVPVKSPEGEMVPKGMIEADNPVYKVSKVLLEGAEDQPIDTLKRLRTQLFEFKEASGFGQFSTEQRLANELYKSLTDDITRAAQEASPKGARLLKEANEYNTFREKRLENKVIQDAAKTEEPSRFVMNFLRDPAPETLEMMADMTGPRFDNIKKSYFSFLKNNPKHIKEWTENLKSKGSSWKKFINEGQMKALEDLGTAYTRMQAHPYQKVLDSAADYGHAITTLIDPSIVGPETMRQYIKDMGGEGSAGHALLKAGVADSLFTKAFRRGEGGDFVFDPKVFRKEMERWQSPELAGTLETLYTPLEMAKLQNVDIISSHFLQGGDVGASLEGAQLISQLKKATGANPMAALQGAHDLLVNRTLGMILMSDNMNRYLVGKTLAKPTDLGFVKAMAVSANDAMDIMDQYIDENTPDVVPPPQRGVAR